jgi:hypothetical protein
VHGRVDAVAAEPFLGRRHVLRRQRPGCRRQQRRDGRIDAGVGKPLDHTEVRLGPRLRLTFDQRQAGMALMCGNADAVDAIGFNQFAGQRECRRLLS